MDPVTLTAVALIGAGTVALGEGGATPDYSSPTAVLGRMDAIAAEAAARGVAPERIQAACVKPQRIVQDTAMVGSFDRRVGEGVWQRCAALLAAAK